MSQSPKVANAGACPICHKPTQPAFAPFCSMRCKQVDLNRWLGEGYAIPGDDIPQDPDDPENG